MFELIPSKTMREYLEPEMPEIINGDEMQVVLIEATTALVDYFNSKTEQKGIGHRKKYADACRKLENALENAETAEDILL